MVLGDDIIIDTDETEHFDGFWWIRDATESSCSGFEVDKASDAGKEKGTAIRLNQAFFQF